MIQSTRRWFRRNRTNFAIGAGVLGAGYLATQYVMSKVTEARQRMSDERIAKENLRRRFTQNQEDCTFTVLAILPTATENILVALPVEQTLAELQRQKAERLARSVGAPSESDLPSVAPSVATGNGPEDETKSATSVPSESYVHASQMGDDSAGQSSSEAGASLAAPKPKKTKLQLWNEVKIDSVARAFTLLYTLSLLTLLTRIQLNLLGRRTYLASVVSLASPQKPSQKIQLENRDDDGFEQTYGNDFETNRKYLSFSWWLLHRGCKDLMEKVASTVEDVFGPVNPREDITLAKLSELTLEVRRRIEGATEEDRRNTKWLQYLLPSPDMEPYVLRESGMSTDDNTHLQPPGATPPPPSTTPTLRRLLDETSDLIDSPPFSHVLTLLLDAAFSHLVDTKIAHQAYKIPQVSASQTRIQELVNPEDAKAKVANTLAVFCRQAHSIGSGAENEYLAAIEGVKDLEAFAAVVYSSHFEFEAVAASDSAPTELVTPATATPAVSMSRPSTADTANEHGYGGRGYESSFVAEDSAFESAWGKALAKEEGKSI